MSAVATVHADMQTLFDPDGDFDPAAFHPAAHGEAQEPQGLRGTTGGGPRLDDLVAGLWEGLAAHRVVECPVCAAEMRPEYGAHALPIGGRCAACGSTLT
jgi:hypothetical protein